MSTSTTSTTTPSPPPLNDAEDALPKAKAKPATKSAAAAETKVFAYHQPFMKAKEIREGIGLPGDVEDGELFALEFVAKHGGADASSGAEDETETSGGDD